METSICNTYFMSDEIKEFKIMKNKKFFIQTSFAIQLNLTMLYSQTRNTINLELRSLFHRTKVLNSALLVLRIMANPLLWSILKRTKGDCISETQC